MGIGSWESTVIKSTDLGILPPLSCGGWDSLLETLDLKPLCLTWPPQKTQLIKTSCLPLYLLESELTTLCHHQLIKDNEESNSPKGFCCSSLAFNIWVFLKFWTRGGHWGQWRGGLPQGTLFILPSTGDKSFPIAFLWGLFMPLLRHFKNSGNPLKSTVRSKAGHMALKALFQKTETCLPFDLACVFTILAPAQCGNS